MYLYESEVTKESVFEALGYNNAKKQVEARFNSLFYFQYL